MSAIISTLVPFALIAVAIVLGLGLFNMMRGGSPIPDALAGHPAICCHHSDHDGPLCNGVKISIKHNWISLLSPIKS